MSISSIGGGVYQSASSLISRAQAGAAADAATVASASTGAGLDVGSADFLNAMIDAKQQVLYTQAGAKMISTANDMMGSLLDIRA
jgi:hypothetical protein